MPSATIKIFLVHGDAKRLRTAELSNWTGKAIAGPRSEFDGLLARDEAQNSGVYFLTGSDTDSGNSAVSLARRNQFEIGSKVISKRTFGTISSSSSARTRISRRRTFATSKAA